MAQPTYCKVFQAVGDFSAIARGTALDCRILLEANYRVSVVAQSIDPELKKEVEWLPLHVPKRGFAVQWLSARHFLKKALSNRQFDVVHAHQPQIYDQCDIFQCHFLTRAVAERGVLIPWKGRKAIQRAQQELVAWAEDSYYRRLARLQKRPNGLPAPQILFISELMQREFHRLYGPPPREQVLIKAPPPPRFPDDEERRSARQKWAPQAGNRLVVGFLGGTNEHKGFRHVVDAMKGENELYLLFGGPDSENFQVAELENRLHSVGFIRDTASFFAACDVFVIASHFEPLGMVALEAAARGVPVVATEGVGALPTLERFGAGLLWAKNQKLGDAARDAARQRAKFNEGARKMCDEFGGQAYGRQLLALCQSITSEK